MGSRAVVVICREAEVARRRFGVEGEDIGVCITRTGRRFFNDVTLDRAFLDAVRTACDRSGLWERLDTDWLCLDTELMPWSVKAQELLRSQYAAVGAAGEAALAESRSSLEAAARRGLAVNPLLEQTNHRAEAIERFRAAYAQYCWDVAGLADLRLAPFHVLASEGEVHVDKDHLWHMEVCAALAAGGEPLLRATAFQVVDLMDPASCEQGIAWWESLVGRGGEGMVVKPLDFIARGSRGLVQPAVKCRGPEYVLPENLERLRSRSLARKRSLALREFALGIESLERFVRGEPLRRVHECVFGVLALESEPVDPRL